MKNEDISSWRETHLPSEENQVCECAGEFICCPCVLKDALEEIARLRKLLADYGIDA